MDTNLKASIDLILAKHLAAIVESSDDAILSKDLDGTILSWNQGAQKLYGYTPKEVIGNSVSLLIPEGMPNELEGIMIKLRRGERIQHFETKRRKKDGSLVDVSLTISPVYDEDSRIIGASAIARDISGQRSFMESRNFIASIVDSSEDAILSKDLDGHILSWNKGAEKLYGYSENEVVGKHVSILTPASSADEIPEIMNLLKKGERIQHYETVRRRKDGNFLTVSLTVSPIRNDSGKVIAASAIARDISFQKRAEEEKAKLLTELTESIAQKNILLQEVYHRVKNNLQVVSSLLELRSRYLSDDPKQAIVAFRESVNRIRAMALVHEKLYKTENLHNLNFLSYLRSLSDQLVRSYNVENRIKVIIKGSAHRFGLNQAVPLGLIFTELLTNSFKYAFASLEKGEIEIDFSITQEHTRILFSDNGTGLPSGVVFEKSESFGFRIIRLLIKQMKAEIKKLRRKKGTTFKIDIPVLAQTEKAYVAP